MRDRVSKSEGQKKMGRMKTLIHMRKSREKQTGRETE